MSVLFDMHAANTFIFLNIWRYIFFYEKLYV